MTLVSESRPFQNQSARAPGIQSRTFGTTSRVDNDPKVQRCYAALERQMWSRDYQHMFLGLLKEHAGAPQALVPLISKVLDVITSRQSDQSMTGFQDLNVVTFMQLIQWLEEVDVVDDQRALTPQEQELFVSPSLLNAALYYLRQAPDETPAQLQAAACLLLFQLSQHATLRPSLCVSFVMMPGSSTPESCSVLDILLRYIEATNDDVSSNNDVPPRGSALQTAALECIATLLQTKPGCEIVFRSPTILKVLARYLSRAYSEEVCWHSIIYNFRDIDD